MIEVPSKIIKPRRLDISLILKGKTWRKITVEISPDEGNAASNPEPFLSPPFAGLGLPTPEFIAGLAMSYQIAQKIHAATEPHKPPVFVNERPRDVVDLLLLRDLANETGTPTDSAIISAIEDIFGARAAEASALDRAVRTWPTRVKAYAHWKDDYAIAADSAGVNMGLTAAVAEINNWLDALEERCTAISS